MADLSSGINLACIDIFERLQESSNNSIVQTLNNAAKTYSLTNHSLPYKPLVDEANQSSEAVYARINLFNAILQTCDDDAVQESKMVYWLEKLDFCKGI